VTGDDGAVDDDSKTVVPITLTATGSGIKARQKAELAWTGSSASGFAVYRNDVRIATVQANRRFHRKQGFTELRRPGLRRRDVDLLEHRDRDVLTETRLAMPRWDYAFVAMLRWPLG
jgi:hypothetical protein